MSYTLPNPALEMYNKILSIVELTDKQEIKLAVVRLAKNDAVEGGEYSMAAKYRDLELKLQANVIIKKFDDNDDTTTLSDADQKVYDSFYHFAHIETSLDKSCDLVIAGIVSATRDNRFALAKAFQELYNNSLAAGKLTRYPPEETLGE